MKPRKPTGGRGLPRVDLTDPKPFLLKLPEATLRRVRRVAATEFMTASEWIRRAIRDALEVPRGD